MKYVNLKQETVEKFNRILKDLNNYVTNNRITYPSTLIFRYKKEYVEYTKYKSNEEIFIEEGIKEYKRYLKWKMQEKVLA